MSRRTVTYAGTSIQTATIKISEIEHESIDHKLLDIEKLGAVDGGKLIDVNFDPRVIRIRGTITGTSIDNLESNIDDFKKLLNELTRKLDIEYASGTRRYECDMARVTVLRRHFNNTFADFEVEFIVAQTPFGTELDTTTMEYTTESVATFSGSFVSTGTYRPLPRIEVTFTEAHNINRLRFRNATTGDMIIVDNANDFNAGDVVIVNTNDYTVTLNGVAWDYSGFFPSFVIDGNDFKVSVESGNRYKLSIKIIYYPLYL